MSRTGRLSREYVMIVMVLVTVCGCGSVTSGSKGRILSTKSRKLTESALPGWTQSCLNESGYSYSILEPPLGGLSTDQLLATVDALHPGFFPGREVGVGLATFVPDQAEIAKMASSEGPSLLDQVLGQDEWLVALDGFNVRAPSGASTGTPPRVLTRAIAVVDQDNASKLVMYC